MDRGPAVPESSPEPPAPAAAIDEDAASPEPGEEEETPYCEGWMVNIGWLNTTLALSLSGLPINYMLKDQLLLDAEALSRFKLLAHIPIYVKPFAGILSDALPLFGTRRRHYLILGLVVGSLLWLALGLAPRTFGSLLLAYFTLNIFLTITSTVLGGLMVEVGQRLNQTGRLGAQRQGITLLTGLVGGPAGGWLSRQPFLLPMGLTALVYAASAPVFWLFLREPSRRKADVGALREVARQGRAIARSRTLWAAAGMVVLVVAAPGFGTPLFYEQTNRL